MVENVKSTITETERAEKAGDTCVQFTGSAGVWCEESGTGDSGFGHASFSSGMLRKEYNYFK